MLHVHTLVFNPFQENTYILYDETGACVVVDPGCYEEDEKKSLSDFILQKNLKVELLLNTHCHIDHVLGNFYVKEKYKTRLLIHQKDEPVLRAVKAYAPNYGMHLYQEALPDSFIDEGDVITFGNQSLKILFVPGHAPGHVVFYSEPDAVLIGGDVLFYNSIGRTDLPGGNYNVLIQSIHEKLFKLPDNVKVYPGHGPATTIGFEKSTNPFCALDK